MTSLTTLRDRPGWFWSGAALLFLGVFLVGMQALLAGTSVRAREANEIIWIVNLVFVLVGAFAMWHGRRSHLDLERRALVRGKTIVRDLSAARLVVTYRLSATTPAHYVILAMDGDTGAESLATLLDRRDGKAMERLSMAVLTGGANDVFFALNGGPEAAAESLASALAKGLGLPRMRAVGDQFSLVEDDESS